MTAFRQPDRRAAQPRVLQPLALPARGTAALGCREHFPAARVRHAAGGSIPGTAAQEAPGLPHNSSDSGQ